MQASFTLAVMLVFQTIIMVSYMAVRNVSELRDVLRAWRVAMWVGASGAVASIGWFTAMTIQNAALVRALGQIELVFTMRCIRGGLPRKDRSDGVDRDIAGCRRYSDTVVGIIREFITMRAVQIQSYGGPEVVEVVDMPKPEPTADQVLVRAHALGVGYPDVLLRTGIYKWKPALPIHSGQ